MRLRESVCILIDISLYVHSLMENAEKLKRIQKDVEDFKENLGEELKQQIAYYRTLEREMCRLKSDIGQQVRQKDRHSLYVFFFFNIYWNLIYSGIHLIRVLTVLQMVKKEWYETEQRRAGLRGPLRREYMAQPARFS